MAKKKPKHDSQWAKIKNVCRLNMEDIRMAKELGISPQSLQKNKPNYEVWWTPILANSDYPWTAVAVGTNGQTNFTLSVGVYQTGFFQVVQDTNLIPLWEAADPNNPGAGILTVYIDNPTNGAVLQ